MEITVQSTYKEKQSVKQVKRRAIIPSNTKGKCQLSNHPTDQYLEKMKSE